MKKIPPKTLNLILSVCALIAMWLVWIIVYRVVGNDYVIPSFSDTLSALWGCLKSGEFWRAFCFTLLRTAGAFVISFLLAALLCLLSVACKPFAAFVKPVVVIFRTLPTIAIVLLLVLWTDSRVTPIIVTALVLFPLIYSQLCAAVGEADIKLLEMASVYGVPLREKMLKIYIPQISQPIFAQIGPNLSLGLKVTVSAEVIANTFVSIGGMMQSARAFVEIPRLAALTLVCVLAGLITEFAFSFLKLINRRWRGEGEASR